MLCICTNKRTTDKLQLISGSFLLYPPLYINEEKVTNWYLAEGLSLPQAKYHISDFFDVSILNKNDLDNYRNLNNNVLFQSFNGLTAIMSRV